MALISFSYKYYGGFLRFLVIIITIYSFCHIDWSGGDHEVAEVNVVTRTERKTIPRHSACIKTDMIENGSQYIYFKWQYIYFKWYYISSLKWQYIPILLTRNIVKKKDVSAPFSCKMGLKYKNYISKNAFEAG